MSLFWNCVNIWVWNTFKALDADIMDVNIIVINDAKTYCKSSRIFGLYFLHYCALLQLQATLERKWWYTKKTIQENRMFSKNRKVWYTNLIYFLCRSLYNTKYWNILILHQKKNGKAVNKFDFLLLPIFYIGNVSFIVTATWLILLKAQFYYRLY